MHEKLAGSVREIGPMHLAPGLAAVVGEGTEQELRPAVVADEAGDGFAVGENIPVRLFRTASGLMRQSLKAFVPPIMTETCR